jgi:hypothetical protein
MKLIKLGGDLLINKKAEIKAITYVVNKRTRKRFTFGEWRKTFKATMLDLSLWDIQSIGYNYLSNEVRADREDVEAEIRYLWDGHECYKEPVIVYYIFGVQIPKSLPKKKREQLLWTPVENRPDLGNYVYAMDNRLEGIAFDDDKRIYLTVAFKMYAKKPFTVIAVGTAPEQDQCEEAVFQFVGEEHKIQEALPW